MITLREVKNAIDQLSAQERAELRAYLNQRDDETPVLRTGTMNIDVLLEAAREIRAGFTDDEWEEVERAMNEEYIKSVD